MIRFACENERLPRQLHLPRQSIWRGPAQGPQRAGRGDAESGKERPAGGPTESPCAHALPRIQAPPWTRSAVGAAAHGHTQT